MSEGPGSAASITGGQPGSHGTCAKKQNQNNRKACSTLRCCRHGSELFCESIRPQNRSGYRLVLCGGSGGLPGWGRLVGGHCSDCSADSNDLLVFF